MVAFVNPIELIEDALQLGFRNALPLVQYPQLDAVLLAPTLNGHRCAGRCMLGRVIQEIRLGKLRRQALREMDHNLEVTDITSFVAAVIQADQLGVSMAKVMRIQSEQMRIRRRQRAEEKAHQAPVKMLFPLVFLIFPAIYIVLLGPAVLVVMDSGVIGTI